MLDPLDARVRAFVVELLDNPVEPPPFPSYVAAEPEPTVRRRMPGWAVALVVFLVVVVVGAASLLLTLLSEEEPVVDTTPQGIVEQLTSGINAADLQSVMSLIAEDAQCVAPGLPECSDLLGFFVAADSLVVLDECSVDIEPYLQCHGYLHTSIHDQLGISVADLEAQPNFPPAFIVEDGKIIQFNFMTPFTGDPAADDAFWAYLQSADADYLNESGIPEFSAEIVSQLLEDARRYSNQAEGG